jgi:hypothetical protein
VSCRVQKRSSYPVDLFAGRCHNVAGSADPWRAHFLEENLKHLDTPVVVINIVALVILGGSALFAMVIVPAIEAARPTPTAAPVTPRPTRPSATPTHTATPTIQPTNTPSGPTPTRPANCAPLPPKTSLAQLTSTPLPIDFRYDLDPNIAPDLKTVVVIYRCNGTWVEYWLGPDRTISNSIYLAAGDVIWLDLPPASSTPTTPGTPVPASADTATPGTPTPSDTPGLTPAATATP